MYKYGFSDVLKLALLVILPPPNIWPDSQYLDNFSLLFMFVLEFLLPEIKLPETASLLYDVFCVFQEFHQLLLSDFYMLLEQRGSGGEREGGSKWEKEIGLRSVR